MPYQAHDHTGRVEMKNKVFKIDMTIFYKCLLKQLALTCLALFPIITHGSPLPSHPNCQSADIIYKNAQFHTMVSDKPDIEALAVKNGKIAALGSYEDLSNACGSNQTQIIDLEGVNVFPGFINTYAHFTLYGWLANHALDLSTNNPFQKTDWTPVKSLEKFLAGIRNNLPTQHQWLYVYGYDSSRMTGPSLKQQDLDQISSRTPIAVFHSQGQYIQFNQAAINLLKKNHLTQNLHLNYEGGMSGEDLNLFLKLLIQGEELKKAQQTAAMLFAQNGFTTVFEAQLIQEWVHPEMNDHQNHAYAVELSRIEPIKQMPNKYRSIQANQTISKHILQIDGLTQNFKAYLSEPYLHPPEPYGRNWQGTLKSPARKIHALLSQSSNQQVTPFLTVHGDAAIDFLISQFKQMNLNAKLFNVQLSSQDQFKKLNELNVKVSVDPATLYFWGESLCQTRLGSARATNLIPYQTIKEQMGYMVAHLDTPSTPPSALDAMTWMTTRIVQRWNYPANRTCPQYFNIDERINPEEALKSLTINAAIFLDLKHLKGTIEVGKDADLTLLSVDPIHTSGQKAEVRGIIKGGAFYPVQRKKPISHESVLMKIEGLDKKSSPD